MFDRIRTSPDPESWERRLTANSQQMDSGCIEWTGAVDDRPRGGGYGRFRVVIDGKKRETGAHRAAWLVWCGDIPGDLVPDHLCRNPPCINVNHMELVTNQVNSLRGDHSGKRGHSGLHRGAVLHTCGKHERSDGYVHMMQNGRTRWVCRICHRAWKAAWLARQAA